MFRVLEALNRDRLSHAFVLGLAMLVVGVSCGDGDGEGRLPPSVVDGLARMSEVCSIMNAEAVDLVADEDDGLVTPQFRERYEDAKDSYTLATARFNGWVDGVRLSFTSGGRPEATAQLREALLQGDSFVVTANVLHLHMHGIAPGPGAAALLPLLEPLIDAGVRIWESHQESERQTRQLIAGELERFSCPAWPDTPG